MSGPFKLKYKNSAFPFKTDKDDDAIKKLEKSLKTKKQKKSGPYITSFIEGGGTGGEHGIISEGGVGYTTEGGTSFGIKSGVISEKSKHHSFTKPFVKGTLSLKIPNIRLFSKKKSKYKY